MKLFASRRLDIKAVRKVVCNEGEGLRLGAWMGGVPQPGPFCWSDASIRILGVWFGPGEIGRRYRSEIGRRYRPR